MVAWKSVLGAFGLFMTRESDKAMIDDFPFQLQYRWTTALLFVFQTIISLTELVGKHKYLNLYQHFLLYSSIIYIYN